MLEPADPDWMNGQEDLTMNGARSNWIPAEYVWPPDPYYSPPKFPRVIYVNPLLIKAETRTSSPTNHEFKRRSVLPVLVNGTLEYALPDTGVIGNVMTEEHAKALGAVIDRNLKNRYNFENAVKTPFFSLGLASLEVSFREDPSRKWKCDFAVVEKCAAPMVLGKAFLDQAEIFTRMRHRLIKAALTITKSVSGQFKKIWRFMLMESSRPKMSCYVDGELALVDPDSGADIDLVSLDYAKLRDWQITALPLDEGFVILSNEDVVKLTGYVDIDLTIRGKSRNRRFYVLDRLQSNVVLGDDTIEEFNIFDVDDDFVDEKSVAIREAFCMIQWLERYDQLETEIDDLLQSPDAGQSHATEEDANRTKRRWPFSRNKNKTSKSTPEDTKLRLRHRLDSLDMIDTDYEDRASKQQAMLSGSALLTAQNDNRKRREAHAHLRQRILSEIAKLEAT